VIDETDKDGGLERAALALQQPSKTRSARMQHRGLTCLGLSGMRDCRSRIWGALREHTRRRQTTTFKGYWRHWCATNESRGRWRGGLLRAASPSCRPKLDERRPVFALRICFLSGPPSATFGINNDARAKPSRPCVVKLVPK